MVGYLCHVVRDLRGSQFAANARNFNDYPASVIVGSVADAACHIGIYDCFEKPLAMQCRP